MSISYMRGGIIRKGRKGAVNWMERVDARDRMTISREERNDLLILHIEGEIDVYNAYELRNEINQAIEKKYFDLIIDLKNVSYIDSSGLGVLVSGVKSLMNNQGSLKLVDLNEKIRSLTKLTGLEKFFEIYDNIDEAIASVS